MSVDAERGPEPSDRSADPTPVSGRRWPTRAVGLTLGALAVAYLVTPSGAATRWLHLGVSTITGLVALTVALRRAWSRSWPWLCTSAAVSLWAVGDWLWSRHDWRELVSPAPLSDADPAYLLAKGVLGAGLVLLVRQRVREPDTDRRIDAAAVALIAALAVWELAVRPTIADSSLPVATRVLWSSYGAIDVILLVLLAWLVVIHRRLTPAAVTLVLGVLAWLVADLSYLVSVHHAGYAFGQSKHVDGFWIAGMVLLAFAAAHPSRAELTTPSPRFAAQARSTQIVLAVTALVVPTATIALTAVASGGALRLSLPLATVTLAVLVALRLVRLDRARDQAELQLRRNERHYRALAANSADAVLIVNGDARITNDSPALAALVGLAGAPTAGASLFGRIAAADQAEARAIFAQALGEPGRVHSLELRVDHTDGSTLWVATRFVNLLEDPAVAGVVVNVHDVTARKNAEAAIEHQAFHDALTGLANRVRFRDRLGEALERPRRDRASPAVLFIDLDRFKGVNDTLGHEAGDDLLRIVAARVRAAVRPVDTVARLGGDEFAVLIEGGGDIVEEASAIAERVLVALLSPVAVAGRSVTVGASIGVAVAEVGSTPSALLSDADIAMYEAKAGGRGRWTLFDPRMRATALERLRLEDDLRGAPDRGELQLVYQPIVDLATGRVQGFEALVRWEHPTLGTLHPDRFVGLAEEIGAIGAIGRWVLQTACRTAATWQREFPRQPPLSISVNLSAQQLLDEHLADEVEVALALAGLDPGALVLEVAETALVELGREAIAPLTMLRRLGTRLAVDGFGTGYASLCHLRDLPIDILKLDRSLVGAMPGGEPAVPDVLRGLLNLGRGLGLDLVAAGIEQPGQLDVLRGEGGPDLGGQGFLFARPLSELDAEALLIDPHGAWTSGRADDDEPAAGTSPPPEATESPVESGAEPSR